MRIYIYPCLLLSFIILLSPVTFGQIVGWDFEGFDGNEESVEATTLDPFLKNSSIVRGDGINPNTLANSFNSSGFTNDSTATIEDAIANNDYIEFTMQAQDGFTVSLSSIDARFRRSSTGPDHFQWMYSLDEFATDGIEIGEVIIYEEEGGNGHDQDIIDLSGITELQDVDSETVITVRLYGWNAGAAGGTFALGRRSGNDLEITGSIGMPPGPVITHSPLGDTESTDNRTVTATITGDDLITVGDDRPVLWYSIDDGGSWTHTYFDVQDGDEFEFTIPGQPIDTEVSYYLAARDNDDVTTNPFGGSGENPPGNISPEAYHSYTILESEPEPEGFVITLSADPDDTSEENRIAFPYAGMGTEDGDIQFYGDDDWTYIDPEFIFYVVAEGDDEIIAAEFYIEWDHTQLSVTIEEGNFFANQNSGWEVLEVDDGLVRVNASSLQGNVAPFPGSYFAEISVAVTEPGFGEISIADVDLRYYDASADEQVEIPSETFDGEIKFYLGDFGREDDGELGDGIIDFNDLMLFSGAYWTERGDDDYRTKYDIGPTDAGGSYFAMPSPDGVIDFEDLVIFSIGYYKSADGELLKDRAEPLRIIAYEPEERANKLSIPIGFEGDVTDVRALSFKFDYPNASLSFIDAAASGELDQEMGFIASREIDGIVQVDASIIREVFSQEGVFAYLHFEKDDAFDSGSIGFISAIARNSGNIDIPVELSTFADHRETGKPVTFHLSQNYPNPFNPVTTIEYQLPENAHVSIVVYNILGEKVAELVRENQESGYYSVEWDGRMHNNMSAPSGLYIYRIQAGEYTEAKRMMLLK